VITTGYVPKKTATGIEWAADIQNQNGYFQPDDTWIDTTAFGEATLSDAVKDTIA